MNDIQIIANKIKTLLNRPPFMLDSDLAMVYGTKTERINQAVKRNPERFPEDFVFQLTKEEAELCNFDITDCDVKKDGRGGRRHLPYGFAREGCNMLSAVLNTPVAIARSIQIMRAFTAMERGESEAMTVLKELASEVKALKQEVCHLKASPPVNINLPDDAALPIAIERSKHHGRQLRGAFRFSDVRDLIFRLRREGLHFEEIAQKLKETWPDDPKRWTSRSSIHRYWQKAKWGLLKEFNIDVTYH